MIRATRLALAGLTLSAAGLVGIVTHEGYTEKAVIPVPGDVPTKGFGMTHNPDGSPVKMGDTTTPVRALIEVAIEAGKVEQALKRCFGDIELAPYEWDSYLSLGYNVGAAAVCRSSIPRKLQAREYEAACKTILDFDGFRDCTKPQVVDPRTGKLVCPLVKIAGLTKRRQSEYRRCLGEAS